MKKIFILMLLLPFAATGQGLFTGVVANQKGTGIVGGGLPVIKLYTKKAFPSCFGDFCDTSTGGDNGKLFFITDNSGDDTTIDYDAATDSYSGTILGWYTSSLELVAIPEVSTVNAINSTLAYWNNSAGGNDAEANKSFIGAKAPFPGFIIYGARIQITSENQTASNWIWRGTTFAHGGDVVSGGNTFGVHNGNSIVDSNTVLWQSDEGIGVNLGATVQYNFHAEGQPLHNTGGLFNDTGVVGVFDTRGTIHNEVYSNISHRVFNARSDVNNVISEFNHCGSTTGARLNSHGCAIQLNDINNYWMLNRNLTLNETHKWNLSTSGNALCQDVGVAIYSTGNYIEDTAGVIFDDRADTADEKTIYSHHISGTGDTTGDPYTINTPLPEEWFITSPHPMVNGAGDIIRTADEAWNYNVLGRNVGSRYHTNGSGDRVKYFLPIIEDYYQDVEDNTTLAFIDDENQMNLAKLAIPAQGPVATDADRDGMTEAFELQQGLDDDDHTDGTLKQAFYYFDNYVVDNRLYVGGVPTGTLLYTNRQIHWEEQQGGFIKILDYMNDGLYD